MEEIKYICSSCGGEHTHIQNTMQEPETDIRNCPLCQPIDRDEARYRTDIIATNCSWRESPELDYTLQSPPQAGDTYLVILHAPVKFHLNMQLWLFYDCPLAFYNGYEKEEEIELARFCQGEITKIISCDEHGATIEFSVSKLLSCTDILTSREPRELPQFWTGFFVDFIDRQDYTFETFGKFHRLSVNVQGELGQSCIFTTWENDFMVCLFKQWSFRQHETFGGKYRLPDELKNRLFK